MAGNRGTSRGELRALSDGGCRALGDWTGVRGHPVSSAVTNRLEWVKFFIHWNANICRTHIFNRDVNVRNVYI